MIEKKSKILTGRPRALSDRIKEIYVEKNVADEPLTKRILQQAGNRSIRVVESQDELNSIIDPEHKGFTANLTNGKKILYLGRNRGRFFKPCPATREYRCCEYQVLNIGMNCPMDCVYCILQAYLNNPWLSIFVNTDDLFNEMSSAFTAEPDRLWRIGTGEFTDSMALDDLTALSRDLVTFVRDKKNCVLELKTKTSCIDNLRGLDHNGRTIVAWSLNSPAIMQGEELFTASLYERLEAAAECAGLGYRLAFHFDPIIYHPDWQEGYRRTVARLFEKVPAGQIAWISMGCLRFLPALKDIAVSRFANSRFFHEEFILGLDNKFRYFRTLRVEMYKFIYGELRKNTVDSTCIYMCMESDEIWQEVFGFIPEDRGGLPIMLDRAAGLIS